MTEQHPITPPPELVQQWVAEIWHEGTPVRVAASDLHIANEAAQWGADQELEACCAWLPKLPPWSADDLRRHRRPSLQSLKEKALKEMDKLDAMWSHYLDDNALSTIRRALEALPDD